MSWTTPSNRHPDATCCVSVHLLHAKTVDVPNAVDDSRGADLPADDIDLLRAVPSDEQKIPHSSGARLFSSCFTRSPASEADPQSTALASLHHSACIIIDMGSYVLSECRNRAYTADDAAMPCIAGEHVRQILPEALVERAALFAPFDPASQVGRRELCVQNGMLRR